VLDHVHAHIRLLQTGPPFYLEMTLQGNRRYLRILLNVVSCPNEPLMVQQVWVFVTAGRQAKSQMD